MEVTYEYLSSPGYENTSYTRYVVIPDMVYDGVEVYSVTSIGGYAFRGCSGLTSVKIPDGVTSIGEGAFEGCSGLESVDIPKSVESIEASAFEGCSALTKVFSLATYPPTLTADIFCGRGSEITVEVPEVSFYAYKVAKYWLECNIVAIGSTGINDAEAQETKIEITGRNITVSGADGMNVAVYNMNGQTVYSATAGKETTIAVPASGTYVVKVGNKTLKVCVK